MTNLKCNSNSEEACSLKDILKEYKDLESSKTFKSTFTKKKKNKDFNLVVDEAFQYAQNHIWEFNLKPALDTCNNIKANKDIILGSKSFNDIISTVYNLKAKGCGPLGIYDLSLYIGAHLGLLPEFVYLHAGVLKAAALLVGENLKEYCYYINNDKAYPYISVENLPKDFNKLPPYQVEDFLDFYYKKFKNKK